MIYNLELEERILSGLIKHPSTYADISSFISEKDFASDENKITKTIFNVLKGFCEGSKAVDHVILSQRVKDLGISFSQDVSISDYIYSLTIRDISEKQVLEVAKELKKITIRRDIYYSAKKVAQTVKNASSSDSFEDIIEAADKAFNSQINLFDSFNDGFHNIYEEMEGFIEYLGENPEENRGLHGPFDRVNDLYGSLLKPGNITVIVARSGVGKMQPLRCKVLTPTGFRLMRDIKRGDEIITPKGNKSKVVKVFDHKKQVVFKILLNDGRYTYCGADHLWKVMLKKDGHEEWDLCDTTELLLKKAKGFSIHLPRIEKITLNDNESFSVDLCAEFSFNRKTIPDYAFFGYSYENRMRLIKKILEFSCYIKKTGKKHGSKRYLCFETDTLSFVEQFKKIIQSVGFLVHQKKKAKRFCLFITGENIQEIVPDKISSMNLKLSKELCEENELFISNITVMSKKENCRCIEIDDPDHLYVTDSFIVTHNTRLCLDYCTKIADMHNVPILHFDNGEMSKEELMIRQCSSLSGVSAAIIEDGWRNAGKEVVDKIRAVWPRIKKLSLVYHGVGGYSLEQMISVLKRYYYSKVGRGNPMVFSFDYIKPRESKTMAEWQYVGHMLDTFKTTIQKDILFEGKPIIPMFTSVQANRSGIVGNRQARALVDDEGIVAMSDRIIQYCSHLFLLRENTLDELEMEHQNFGTHRLINLKARHLGEFWERAISKVQMPDERLVKNCIHLNMRGFNIECLGDTVDLLNMLNANNLRLPENQNEEDPMLN
jgi:replicative DNA helicase